MSQYVECISWLLNKYVKWVCCLCKSGNKDNANFSKTCKYSKQKAENMPRASYIYQAFSFNIPKQPFSWKDAKMPELTIDIRGLIVLVLKSMTREPEERQ